MYRMSFPTTGGPQKFTVKVFRGQVATRAKMIVHFLHIYVRDTVIILEEGNLPHPPLPKCYMMVMWKYLNTQNTTTT